MNDQEIEQEIIDKGLTAKRVRTEYIDSLMDRVQYFGSDVAPGTTSTFVHAFLDGKFYLATGHSACISPLNFDAELGIKIAKDKAQHLAREELWKLEGYRVFCELNQGE